MADLTNDRRGSGWTYLTTSDLVTAGPALLWGCLAQASVDGQTVTLYEGQDATSGRPIAALAAGAAASQVLSLARPLLCPRGLYASLGASITACTVFWEPAQADRLGPAPGGRP